MKICCCLNCHTVVQISVADPGLEIFYFQNIFKAWINTKRNPITELSQK